MALTACPDCDSPVSSLAPACPKCGRPMKAAVAHNDDAPPRPDTKQPPCRQCGGALQFMQNEGGKQVWKCGGCGRFRNVLPEANVRSAPLPDPPYYAQVAKRPSRVWKIIAVALLVVAGLAVVGSMAGSPKRGGTIKERMERLDADDRRRVMDCTTECGQEEIKNKTVCPECSSSKLSNTAYDACMERTGCMERAVAGCWTRCLDKVER